MKNKRILIVEDDRNALAGLQEILTFEGYQVAGATRGTQALQTLAHRRFDILLTDLQLPDSDGLTLHRAAMAGQPGLQTVVMTAVPGFGAICEDTGVFAWLPKPLCIDDLLVALQLACRGQKTDASLYFSSSSPNHKETAFSFSPGEQIVRG